MAPFPRWNLLAASLAACGLAASMIVASAQPAAAQGPDKRIEAAWGLYLQGKGLNARRGLARLAKDKDPAVRLAATQALLDLCIHAQADACVVETVGPYLELAKSAPFANEVQRRERVREAAYYLDSGKFALGRPEITAQILKDEIWKQENAFNGALYLRRQALAANIALAQGERASAVRSVDKVLSLVATLENPQDDRFLVAWALADAMAVLTELGETERAYGVYRASGDFVAKALPPLSVDAALYRLTEGQLLQEQGDLKGAALALEAAVAALKRIELEPDARGWMLGDALTLQAAVCLAQGRADCARQALAEHPYARLYKRPGRQPATFEETAYLAARGLLAAIGQTPDPVAAAALSGPLDFTGTEAVMAQAQAYRAAGAALASPPGPARQEGLAEAGRRLVAAAELQRSGAFGGWRRPGAVDQMLIAMALTQADGAQAEETAFGLAQLAARQGATFDSDALTVLAQARDELQRREVHQALRLRARRDRYERAELQKAAARADAPATGAPILRHQYEPRGYFRDFAGRMAAVDRKLAADGVATSGANLISLARFQTVLGEDEAALSVARTPGGMAYVCVRRESVVRKVLPADPARAAIDVKVLQAALTASHAPSDALDAQFPAEAAVRLYDLLIGPFEDCLKDGDHVLWLPNASITPLPLAALLARVPPKLAGGGYDLSQADWLVRRYALSYAGSPAAVVAARAAARRPTTDFDFLGIGDPILSGATAGGEDRAGMLLRGVRGGAGLATLAPLPDTTEELQRSAAGFSSVKLLTQAGATEQGVRGQLIGGYRFLSFATHGLLREDLQGLSEPALALTPVSSADPADDGLLTASEIADLNLSARFVALSACNTANFDLSQMAADLPALASAFAVAGVPSTLGALWAVDSLTGKEVVAQTFATLRTAHGESPARALASAQRAFLAAPPGLAYLHPRFWSALVVLGDGGTPPPPDAPGPVVTTVETLSQGGGEVVALDHADQATITHFGAKDAQGRSVAAATSLGPQTWRRTTAPASAANILLRQPGQVIVGAVERGATGRYVPTLQALDARSGEPRAAWRGEAPPEMDAFPMDGALTPSGAMALVVADRNLRARAAGRGGGDGLRVLTFDAALKPRLLASVAPPPETSIDEATVTPWGDALLVTYSQRFSAPASGPLVEDDFDDPVCGALPTTWLELRDARTGALRAASKLEGWVVVATSVTKGKIVLGGAHQGACIEEARAGLLALDTALNARVIYRDESLGMSEARSLLARPDGSLLAAAYKQSLVEFRPADERGAGASAGRFAAMLIPVAATGEPGRSKLLDSGGDVLISAMATDGRGELVLGGAVGGEAALVRLTPRAVEPSPRPAS